MDNKLKIINFFGKNIDDSFTMHELSHKLKIPYASFYRTISGMQDMLIKKKKGQAYTIEVNTNEPVIKSYLAIASEEEKKEFLTKHPIISKISESLPPKDVVVLFGSYAKGTEMEQSDIDILIINKGGKKTVSFSKYEMLFKKKINPVFIKFAEFKKMLKEKEENVGKQALKTHIILSNPEKFWECAL